jgi:hypothetical protein
LEEIRRADAAKSHLLKALAFTREGMIGDAKREVDALSALNPSSPLIRQLHATLSAASAAGRHQPLPTTTNADQ